MKFKINRSLVPVKVHFFFFFAALGPLLPQMNVFGRQLGVSPGVMGLVTAVLPLLWAAAKPLFGYVVDYWPTHRKLVFMMLIALMSGSYCCLWFLPMPDPPGTEKELVQEFIYNLNDTIYLKELHNSNAKELDKYNCHWTCSMDDRFDVYLSNSSVINTVYLNETVFNSSCSVLHMEFAGVREGQIVCKTLESCNLICIEDSLPVEVKKEYENTTLKRTKRNIERSSSNHIQIDLSKGGLTVKDIRAKVVSKMSSTVEPTTDNVSFYMTGVFWAFVIFMCVGTVAFNVANCIGDAVCFDVLGPEKGSKYGAQRAWGTAGYGVTALLGGWLIDTVSSQQKDFTPAFIVAIVATIIDLFACRSLNLPSLTSPDDSGKALREVLKIPRVIVFIIFAVVAGTFDSFIIYYMFWFLEELAEETGQMGRIKLIEGVVVAGQSFIGELVFFYFSGKILKRWGYGTTMSFSLFCYGVRLLLISFIQHPWHLVFIESLMQGPTYALCYATIVGYAARVAPEGYSATVQGIVAGMDDGVGFALGSLVGGQLYSCLGGRQSFRALAATAVLASLSHAALFVLVFKKRKNDEKSPPTKEEEKMLPIDSQNQIYKDTVEPLPGV